MRSMRKKSLFFGIVLIMMGLGLGYAFLTTNLMIDGTAEIDSNTWNVYWDNVVVTEGSVGAETPVIDTDKITVSYSAHLSKQGDFYEFTVDAINDGSIDAMIEAISHTINGVEIEELPDYLRYDVTYDDSAPIRLLQKLDAGTQETIRIKIVYREDILPDSLPSTPQTLDMTFSIQYSQKDSRAIDVYRMDVGSYITLVPDESSYVVTTDLTGNDSDVTIHPNELTLWRVIQKNSDGTIEAVSHYTSSTAVYIRGAYGYAHLVGSLQEIASHYHKEGFTKSVREIGYNGQTLVIQDTSLFDGTNGKPSLTTTPQPTEGTGEEYLGGAGGDTLYLRDYQLVSNAYQDYSSGSMGARPVNASYSGMYYFASRSVSNSSSNIIFGANVIYTHGELTRCPFRTFSYEWNDATSGYYLRPIITLKPGIIVIGGEGTINNPYILDNPSLTS